MRQPTGSSGWKRAPAVTAAVFSFAVCLSAGGSVAVGADSPSTATSPAGADVLPTGQGLSVDEAANLTVQERVILDGVIDGDEEFQTSGLYVLLARAAMLPDGREAFDQADKPNPANFWKSPAVYRGRLVAFWGVYAGRTDVQPPASNKWWDGREYYLMHVKVPKTPDAIVVALAERPGADIRTGARVGFAGFFYKNMLWNVSQDSGDPTQRRVYPVVVARGVLRPTEAGASTHPWLEAIGKLGVLIGVIVVFLLVRIYLRARHRKVAAAHLERLSADSPVQDAEVDGELCRAVERYQSALAGPPKDKAKAKKSHANAGDAAGGEA